MLFLHLISLILYKASVFKYDILDKIPSPLKYASDIFSTQYSYNLHNRLRNKNFLFK